ncbi:MAG: hypothetical protein AB8G23_13730 [Myxococcota bacterium]
MPSDATKKETAGSGENETTAAAEAEARVTLRRSIGLCADCQFRREQRSQRGSIFYRCARADGDDAFSRYPPLPVLRCRGFLEEESA